MSLPLGPLILHSLQLGYLCFHFSVAVAITVKIVKKDADFFKGFYILYVIQSFFDVCSLFVQVPTRLYAYADVPLEVLNHSAAGIALHFATGFCLLSQECYHAAIAYNRYTAFRYFVQHERLWTGRYLLGAVVISTLIAFAGAFSRLFAHTEVIYLYDGYALLNRHVPSAMATKTCATVLVISSTALCIVLEVRSFMLYRALPVGVSGRFRDDCRLLVYAFMQLVVQMFLAVDYVLLLIYAQDTPVQHLAATVYPAINTMLSFSSSFCLFITR